MVFQSDKYIGTYKIFFNSFRDSMASHEKKSWGPGQNTWSRCSADEINLGLGYLFISFLIISLDPHPKFMSV